MTNLDYVSISIRYMFLQLDVSIFSETVNMKLIKHSDAMTIQGPPFATIQEGCQYDSSVHSHFSCNGNSMTTQQTLTQPPKCDTGFTESGLELMSSSTVVLDKNTLPKFTSVWVVDISRPCVKSYLGRPKGDQV